MQNVGFRSLPSAVSFTEFSQIKLANREVEVWTGSPVTAGFCDAAADGEGDFLPAFEWGTSIVRSAAPLLVQEQGTRPFRCWSLYRVVDCSHGY